jgi:hypothetical protein
MRKGRIKEGRGLLQFLYYFSVEKDGSGIYEGTNNSFLKIPPFIKGDQGGLKMCLSDFLV